MTDKWYFEHDEFDCEKCETSERSFPLNFYTGIHNGRDSNKYACSNKKCNYEEIIYIDELMIDERGNVTKVTKK